MATIDGTTGNNRLTGTDDPDTINADGGQDEVRGGGGADTINGGDEAGPGDGIVGEGGDDVISGGAGDDVLGGGAGADTLNGDDGADQLWGLGGGLRVFPAAGTTPTGPRLSFALAFFGFVADREVDTLSGGAGDDFLYASFGDIADGGSGTDLLTIILSDLPSGINLDLSAPGSDAQTALAGLADATLSGFERFTVVATDHGDVIRGNTTTTGIFAEGGDDFVQIADFPSFEGGAVIGGTGADTLRGGTGADRLYHGDNQLPPLGILFDSTDDGAVDDIEGGGGDDSIHIGLNDRADGGIGNDSLTLSFFALNTGLTLTLSVDPQAALAAASGATLSNFERFVVYGSLFADDITGNAAVDNLDGEAGDDRLDGAGGRDLLRGGLGRDVLIGGTENDQLFGGAGADTLIGGAGNDFLDGDRNLTSVEYLSGGPDIAVFSGLRSAYTITLFSDGSGLVVGPDGSDAIRNIERLQFSDQVVVLALGSILDATSDGQSLTGTDGDDDIRGFGGDNTLLGGNGNDVIDGGVGNDQLRGNAGNDLLLGGDGDDFLRGGSGVDAYNGGSGVDRVSFAEGNQGAVADLRTQLVSNDGYGNVETMISIEHLGAGTRFVDVFDGDDGDNFLAGVASGDTLRGHGGDDFLSVEDGMALLFDGGDGVDSVLIQGTGALFGGGAFTRGVVVDLNLGVTVGANLAEGRIVDVENVTVINAFGDVLIGDAQANTLAGGGGDDRLQGGLGDDTLKGEDGNDTADYSDAPVSVRVSLGTLASQETGHGRDTLTGIENLIGGDFADRLDGSAGDNLLEGGDGADTLSGGAGNDTLRGGSDADLLNGGPGADRLEGGAGSDTYYVDELGDVIDERGEGGVDLGGAERVVSSVSFALPDFVETLTLTGMADLEATGNDGTNRINGNDGANTLRGGGGDDRIVGGGGNDVINGGSGRDGLTGGAGADTFVFDLDAGNLDSITDFLSGVDKIDLSAFRVGEDDILTRRVTKGSTVVEVDQNGDGTIDFRLKLTGTVVTADGDFIF